VVLGVRSWRAPVTPAGAGRAAAATAGLALYRQGALVALSNPKAILFAAAFLPQFIDPAMPALPQLGILLATFAVIEVCWYLAYAASGARLAQALQRATVLRAFNRATGVVFVAFAVSMLLLRD